jgi:hypothetical protein
MTQIRLIFTDLIKKTHMQKRVGVAAGADLLLARICNPCLLIILSLVYVARITNPRQRTAFYRKLRFACIRLCIFRPCGTLRQFEIHFVPQRFLIRANLEDEEIQNHKPLAGKRGDLFMILNFIYISLT